MVFPFTLPELKSCYFFEQPLLLCGRMWLVQPFGCLSLSQHTLLSAKHVLYYRSTCEYYIYCICSSLYLLWCKDKCVRVWSRLGGEMEVHKVNDWTADCVRLDYITINQCTLYTQDWHWLRKMRLASKRFYKVCQVYEHASVKIRQRESTDKLCRPRTWREE